jgi:hypothetical protein
MVGSTIRRLIALVAAGALSISVAGTAFAATIHWTGNGTTAGECDTIIFDVNQPANTQTWVFVLTRPTSNATHELRATFTDGAQTVGPSKVVGSVHFEVTTVLGATLLAANADNGTIPQSVLTVSHCIVPPNGEACSPGFWRNHPALYTDELFNSVFGALVNPAWSLTDALNHPGGTSPEPNPNNANFIGTGAYLSSLHVAYPYSTAFVIQAVQDAHAGDPTALGLLADTFAPGHVCPL